MKDMITVNDKMYVVKRTVKESLDPIIDAWKQATHTEFAFKKNGYVFFCNEIEEAEIVEEVKFDLKDS